MRNDIYHLPPSRDELKRLTITCSSSCPGSCMSILTCTEHSLVQDDKLFNVIFRTPIGGVLPLCREAVGVFYSSSMEMYLHHGRNIPHTRPS